MLVDVHIFVWLTCDKGLSPSLMLFIENARSKAFRGFRSPKRTKPPSSYTRRLPPNRSRVSTQSVRQGIT